MKVYLLFALFCCGVDIGDGPPGRWCCNSFGDVSIVFERGSGSGSGSGSVGGASWVVEAARTLSGMKRDGSSVISSIIGLADRGKEDCYHVFRKTENLADLREYVELELENDITELGKSLEFSTNILAGMITSMSGMIEGDRDNVLFVQTSQLPLLHGSDPHEGTLEPVDYAHLSYCGAEYRSPTFRQFKWWYYTKRPFVYVIAPPENQQAWIDFFKQFGAPVYGSAWSVSNVSPDVGARFCYGMQCEKQIPTASCITVWPTRPTLDERDEEITTTTESAGNTEGACGLGLGLGLGLAAVAVAGVGVVA